MAGSEKFDLIVRARDEASRNIKGVTKAIGGMVAGAVAVQKIAQFLKGSIDAALESERVWNDLSAAVERHGMVWDDAGGRLRQFATAMQNTTGMSDEAIAKSLQMFIDFGATASQAMRRVRVAADLAAGGNMNLASASDLVAKASVGYTSTLSRYGIILDESIPKAQKFEAAIAQINERFSGAAQARMDTSAGKIELLNQRFGDLQEKIGGLILKGFDPMLDTLNDIIGALVGVAVGMDELNVTTGDLQMAAREQTRASRESSDAMDDLIRKLEQLNPGMARLGTQAERSAAAHDELMKSFAGASGEADSAGLAIADMTGNYGSLIDRVAVAITTANKFLAELEDGDDKTTALSGSSAELNSVLSMQDDILAELTAQWKERNREGRVALEQARAMQREAQKPFDIEIEGQRPTELLGIADEGRRIVEESKRAAAEAIAGWQEYRSAFAGVITTSVDQMITEVMRGRAEVGKILEAMVEDFIRAFARIAIARAAASFFSFLFPGPIGAVAGAAAGGTSSRRNDGAVIPAPQQTVTNYHFHQPVITTSMASVAAYIAPALERGARAGQNNLAVRR